MIKDYKYYDIELMEKAFPVRNIIPYDLEFWSELKSKLPFRRYRISEINP